MIAIVPRGERWPSYVLALLMATATCVLLGDLMLQLITHGPFGWHLSREMNTQMTSRALQQAIRERCPQPGLIHHSDRGVQYASHDYIAHLQVIGARISMSAVGNPYDNAKAESFFKTLKQEEVYLKEYNSFADAEQNLTTFIEKVYNEKRLHSSLGYLPPAEFEAAYTPVAGS